MDKIAFVIPGDPDRVSGGYIYNRKVLEALRRKNIPVHMLNVPMPGNDMLHSVCEEIFSQPGYKTIIVDGLAGAHLAGLIGNYPHKVIYLEHLPQIRSWDGELEAIQGSSRVIATSSYTADWLKRQGVDTPVSVIVPGCETEGTKTSYRPSAKNLLFVGTAEPRKGLIELIHCLGNLEDLDWKLEIAGEFDAMGEYGRQVSQALGKIRGADRFGINGPLTPEGINQLMLESDLLISPSFDETYGMAVAESLSVRLPVICRDIPAYRENFGPMVRMFTDDRALGQIISELVSSPEAYAKEVSRSQKNIFRKRSWEEVACEFEEVLWK